MTQSPLTDKTGAAVSVALEEDSKAYALSLEDGTVAGRTFYTPAPEAADDWIFYHTEVDEQFGGRGLGGILVGEAMADAAAKKKTVVPLCPFVKGWIEKNSDDYAALGGTTRKAAIADVDAARSASKGA